MKWKLWLMAMMAAMLLSAGAAWADDMYVVMAGGGVGTRIASLPCTISNPGFYYLSGNLTYSGDGNAITVTTDNVTLDLMGFSLINSGAVGSTCGIYLNGRTNVEIRNGTVQGFWIGVLEESDASGKQHRIINVRATNNTFGIYLYGINHLIKNCNASNNTYTGLGLTSGVVADCIASNNSFGIRLLGPGNVLGNTAINNTANNFYLGEGVATAILVDRNSAFGLDPNYYEEPSTTGIIYGTNAGTPIATLK